MPTPKKEAIVEHLAKVFETAPGVYFADFSGLNTRSFTLLRKQLREQSVQFQVVKNTLIKLAVKRANFPDMSEWLTGSTAITYGENNIAPVKALAKFVKDNDVEMPVIKTGIVDGEIISLEHISLLAELPDLPELQAKFLGTLMAPASGLVRLLNAAPAGFVRVLEARRQQQDETPTT